MLVYLYLLLQKILSKTHLVRDSRWLFWLSKNKRIPKIYINRYLNNLKIVIHGTSHFGPGACVNVDQLSHLKNHFLHVYHWFGPHYRLIILSINSLIWSSQFPASPTSLHGCFLPSNPFSGLVKKKRPHKPYYLLKMGTNISNFKHYIFYAYNAIFPQCLPEKKNMGKKGRRISKLQTTRYTLHLFYNVIICQSNSCFSILLPKPFLYTSSFTFLRLGYLHINTHSQTMNQLSIDDNNHYYVMAIKEAINHELVDILQWLWKCR